MHRHNFKIQNALVPLMTDEDDTFAGLLVLDLRIWWLCVKTLCKYCWQINRLTLTRATHGSPYICMSADPRSSKQYKSMQPGSLVYVTTDRYKLAIICGTLSSNKWEKVKQSTIPDKRVGIRSKFSPPPTFNVDNQVFFSFLLEKTWFFQHWLGAKRDMWYSSSVPATFGRVWSYQFKKRLQNVIATHNVCREGS